MILPPRCAEEITRERTLCADLDVLMQCVCVCGGVYLDYTYYINILEDAYGC